MKYLLFFTSFIFISLNIYCFEEVGIASWYGPNFHGKKTANGEIFNTYDYTAAHKTLAFGSIVKVVSLENNKSTIVRINDRGPFAKGRIIDLSKVAASELGMLKTGTMKVKTILLERGDNKYHKFKQNNYTVQVASFSDNQKAEKLFNSIKDMFDNIKIKKVKIKRDYYYRVLINDLNYYDLQGIRVKLHKKGINNYLITRMSNLQ